MFDVAMGFMLHHELAHHRLRHGDSEYEVERDADYEAARWLLEGLKDDSPVFIYRAHGIAMALGVLSARGIHLEQFESSSHPRAFDRLFDTLTRFVEYPHHPAWKMAVAILRLHLDASRINVPVGKYRNARECADAYVEALAGWTPSDLEEQDESEELPGGQKAWNHDIRPRE